MAGGADGQIGFASETTPGTAVPVDQFLPFRSENIKNNLAYLDTQTISARKTLRLSKRGSSGIAGSITTELPNTTLATLLRHMFGDVETTGTGPYTHVATPDDLDGQAMTVQVGRPATGGTVHPFTYAGCKVAEWTLNASVDEIATLALSLVGMTETTATALAAASYDADWEPFTFVEGSVSIDGTPIGTVRTVQLVGRNGIEPRPRIGSSIGKEPLETAQRSYTGQITTDFDSLTHYQLYLAGTPADVVLSFDNGTETLTFDMTTQFTGETPEVAGFGLLAQNLPYRCLSTESDADAITATLVNGEASA